MPQSACTVGGVSHARKHVNSCNPAANRSTSHLFRELVRSTLRKLNRRTRIRLREQKIISKSINMTKDWETVATMACMKGLLMLFNCVLWVRGCFFCCNPPLTRRLEKTLEYLSPNCCTIYYRFDVTALFERLSPFNLSLFHSFIVRYYYVERTQKVSSKDDATVLQLFESLGQSW